MSMTYQERQYLLSLIHLGADTSDCVMPLYQTALDLRAERIIELGVREGVSTRALLLAAKQLEAHLWSVDLDPCISAAQLVDSWHLTQNWTFIRSDSREFLRSWRGAPVDMVFIDSGHSYELTLEELELGVRRLWPWGVILLHDTKDPNYPGVLQAIQEFMKSRQDRYRYEELGPKHGLGKISPLKEEG